MTTNDKIKAVVEEFRERFINENSLRDSKEKYVTVLYDQVGNQFADTVILENWLQHRLETLVREELKEIHDEIPEAYGWGKEDEEADRGYRICSKNVKAMIRRRIADYQQ